jgi:uroporphyrinogen decarboxylase
MSLSMTSRERVLAALAHTEPDRVPLDLGGTLATGINYQAYDELLAYLGIEDAWAWESLRGHTVKVAEPVRQRLHLDCVYVGVYGPAPARVWQEGNLECYRDEWGVEWACPPGGHYYTSKAPFAGEKSLADLNAYPWPDPTDPVWVEGLAERVEAARRLGDYAVCLNVPVGFGHQSQFLRGYEDWLTDLLLNRPFAEGLMDRVLEFQLETYRRALSVVGDRVDVVCFGDDIGFQTGPMVSPRVYAQMIAPRQRRVFETLHAHSPAPVFYHTCGSVVDMIPQLIDMGVDILNPIQVSAAGMEPARLKQEYGNDLCFWGAIDTHRVMPYGTPGEVRDEVRRRIDELADGGGYILATVHNVQHGMPVVNVVTMCEEAVEYGRRQ